MSGPAERGEPRPRRVGSWLRASILWICLAHRLTGGEASAAGAETVLLRWEDVERVVDDHPALLAAAGRLDQASAEEAASRKYPNPALGANTGRAEALEGLEEGRIWELELNLPLILPGAYRGTVAAAEAEREAVALEAAALRLEVLRRLKSLFWRLVCDQQRFEAYERTRDQVNRLVEIAGIRVEMGEARTMELRRLEIELARLDVDRREAAEMTRMRRRLLDLWLGSTLPADFSVAADLARLPELPPLEQAVTQAYRQHPDLQASLQRIRAAASHLRVERNARVPEVRIGGFFGRELDSRNYGAALEFSVPLWNWNSAGIARARAAESTARHLHDLRGLELEAALQESHASATVAFERARSLRDRILPGSLEVTEALERMYRIGEADLIDVLDARRGQIEVEFEVLEAYLDSQLAYLELATLMGECSNE